MERKASIVMRIWRIILGPLIEFFQIAVKVETNLDDRTIRVVVVVRIHGRFDVFAFSERRASKMLYGSPHHIRFSCGAVEPKPLLALVPVPVRCKGDGTELSADGPPLSIHVCLDPESFR